MKTLSYLKRYKIQLAIIVLLIVFTLIAIFAAREKQKLDSNAQTPQANIEVNFINITTSLAPYAFSGGISTYGGNATIVANQKQRTILNKLGLGMYRVPIQWNNGNPISSATGGPTNISADAWIAKIREIGAEPMIVIGGSRDNNFVPNDAASLVRHFSGDRKVTYWVIGNEPDLGDQLSVPAYCELFNQSVQAMKAVDPTIKVAGPAFFDYDNWKIGDYEQFLQCGGNAVDIVDFHDYGDANMEVAGNFGEAERYAGKIAELRGMINRLVPQRTQDIAIQVGEYGYGTTGNGPTDQKYYSGATTVWAALAAGSIAKGGGRGHQYSDLNNRLGLTFESSDIATQYGKTIADPMPFYHGLGMFTGEGLFRKFGTQIVQTKTTLPNVTVYASTNEKNIVVINKDAINIQTASIQLTGFSGGTADVWQTDKDKPFDAPVKKATISVPAGNALAYQIPPYSVTTFVLNESAQNPSESPTILLADTPTPMILPTNTPIPTIIPSLMPTSLVAKNERQGLTASYFANKTLSGTPIFTTIEPAINLQIGQSSPYSSIPKNKFSVRWTGYVIPQHTQRYTFYTRSDDGVRLWINGTLLINRWKDQSGKEYNKRIKLSAGKKYQIVMEYYENYGDAVAQLFWSSPSTPKQIIPTANLLTQE